MTHAPSTDLFHQQIRSEAGRLTWLGVGLLVLGFVSLFLPMLATLVATLFVGGLLFVNGAATLFSAFSVRGTGPFVAQVILGLLSVAGGVFLMFQPAAGAGVLTFAIGVLFLIQGAAEAFMSMKVRPDRGWGWMLASAAISVLLAVLILAHWPDSSTVTLGVLMGVNFLTSGAAYLAVASAVKGVMKGVLR